MVKSCSLDPIPTFLLRECIDIILPFLTAMVNKSLRDGNLPAAQKAAVVTPLLQKTSFDQQDLKNYRPVSNLSFVSKLVERFAVKQFMTIWKAVGSCRLYGQPIGATILPRLLY